MSPDDLTVPPSLDFQTDVLEASHSRPIVVDFWAPWCGPCRALGPTLEKLDLEAGDWWTLVKVNTDEYPELMQRYGIRGIPAVKLFVEGEVAGEFTGALPEAQVRQWLEQHIPSAARKQVQSATAALEAGDRTSAIATLEDALPALEAETAPWAVIARVDLARLIVLEDAERATTLVEGVHTSEADAVRVIADALGRDVADLPEGGACEQVAAALEAVQSGDLDAALGSLVEAIQGDRFYDDDRARELAVALFLTLGEAHPVVKAHRPAFNRSLY